MRIKKISNTDNPKYPKKVKFKNGFVLRVPQQKNFGKFSRDHGCSLVAINECLQLLGIDKNPDEIYDWCRRNLSGNTGSKIAIMGVKRAINRISKTSCAKYMTVTGTKKNRKEIIAAIKDCLKKDGFVAVECDNPIHTNLLIAKRTGGAWNATNGTVKKTTIRKMVKSAIKRNTTKAKQTNWYSVRDANCGIVLVYPKGTEV